MPPRVLAPVPPPTLEPLSAPPTFAIVITAYEVEDTIAAAVDSALAQTHPAEEVIVVDDGSSDGIGDVLAPYGDRIRVVRKQNGGGASARNAGVEACSTEFMAILDADDTYDPRRLEAMASLARDRPDLDLVTTDARYVVDGEGAGTYLEHNPFATEDQRTAILETCFPGGWPALRVTTLDRIGGFDESFRIAYDWECWMRLIMRGGKAGLVDAPYYDYVLHQGSLISNRSASLAERVELLEKASAEPGLGPEQRPTLARELRSRRAHAARGAIDDSLFGDEGRAALIGQVRGPGVPPRMRALATLAWLAPPLARRVLTPEQSPEQHLSKSSR